MLRIIDTHKYASLGAKQSLGVRLGPAGAPAKGSPYARLEEDCHNNIGEKMARKLLNKSPFFSRPKQNA